MNLRDFLAELRRRRVFRVAGIYAIVGWLAIQVAATTFPVLMLPDWTVRLVVALFLLGIPVVVVLAWIFDLTPEGIERTATVDTGEGEAPPADVAASPRVAGRIPAWAVAVLVAAALGVTLYRYAPGDTAGTRGAAALLPAQEELDRSIAVLPFANLSAGADTEYFSDGVTEDILAHLSRVAGLRVTSRTSVMGYKGTTKNVRQIGEELGVSHILEGSVRRSGDQVRITAQLIDARADEHRWSESFDRRLEDIFAIQSEIATAIAGALQLRLTAGERGRLVRGGTRNVAAYDHYLRGRAHLNRGFTGVVDVRAGVDRAIGEFQQALLADPSFARANAGIASAWLIVRDRPRPTQRDSIVHYARLALAGDPELAQAHVYVARAYTLTGELDAARVEFDRALRLGPDDPEVLAVVGGHSVDFGRFDEAVRHFARAVALDPSVPGYYDGLTHAYMRLGDYDRAEEWLRRRYQRFPQPARMHSWLGDLALARGDLQAAEEHHRLALSHEPDAWASLIAAARLEIVRGNPALARTYLDRMFAMTGERPQLAMYARVLFQSGDSARALELVRQREEIARREHRECGGTCWNDLLASLSAVQGRSQEALDHLQRAVDTGWRGYFGGTSPYGYYGLEAEPRYQRMMAEIQADLERQRARLRREGL